MDIPAIHIHPDKGQMVKYNDPIYLSNACRAFYQSRLEATRRLKERWKDNKNVDEVEDVGHNTFVSVEDVGHIVSVEDVGHIVSVEDVGHIVRTTSYRSKKKHSLDAAIELLRKEMASLMDQDLCLMKQLLTLNEEIEDLKWRRNDFWRSASSFCSSDMIQSAVSLGRAEEHPKLQFSTPSSLSLQLEDDATTFSVYNDEDPTGTFNRFSDTIPSFNITCFTKPSSISQLDKTKAMPSSSSYRKSFCLDKKLNTAYYQNGNTGSNSNTSYHSELCINDNQRNINNKSESSRVTVPHFLRKQPASPTTTLVANRLRNESLQSQSFSTNDEEERLRRTDIRSSFSSYRKTLKDFDVDTESHDSGIHDSNNVDV